MTLPHPAESGQLGFAPELTTLLYALAPAPDPQRSLARARVRTVVMSVARQRWTTSSAQTAFGSWALRPAGFAFAAAAVVCSLSGGSALVASASALPGEPLYAVKLAVEDARVSIAGASGDQSAQAALHAQLAQRRVEEAHALVERRQMLPPAALEAAQRHIDKAEDAAARLPQERRAEVASTLTAAHDQRAETLNRLLTSQDLPRPAQTAVAAALDHDRNARAQSQQIQRDNPNRPAKPPANPPGNPGANGRAGNNPANQGNPSRGGR